MKAFLLSVSILASSVVCQGEQQDPKKSDPQAVLKEVLASFKKQGIKLDSKARTVTIPAVVNQAQDPIEYLLIHRRGKKHEAMFLTESKPSILNGCKFILHNLKRQSVAFEFVCPISLVLPQWFL